ncbi:TPA: propanediol utilization protein, partial [Escherichia coli]
RYARLAKTCHLCPDNANDIASLNTLIQHIEQLKTTCKLPTLTNVLKEKKAEWSIRIPDMVQAALTDATLRTNPRAADATAIAELLEELL